LGVTIAFIEDSFGLFHKLLRPRQKDEDFQSLRHSQQNLEHRQVEPADRTLVIRQGRRNHPMISALFGITATIHLIKLRGSRNWGNSYLILGSHVEMWWRPQSQWHCSPRPGGMDALALALALALATAAAVERMFRIRG
jgi:hypothetical protein